MCSPNRKNIAELKFLNCGVPTLPTLARFVKKDLKANIIDFQIT